MKRVKFEEKEFEAVKRRINSGHVDSITSIVFKKGNIVQTHVPFIYRKVMEKENLHQRDRADCLQLARTHASIFAAVTLGPLEAEVKKNELANEMFEAALKEIGCRDHNHDRVIRKAFEYGVYRDDEVQVLEFVKARIFLEQSDQPLQSAGQFKEFMMLRTCTDFQGGNLYTPESVADILLVLMARKGGRNVEMKIMLDECVLGEDDVIWIQEVVIQLAARENKEMINWIKSKKNLRLMVTLATNQRYDSFCLAEHWCKHDSEDFFS